MYMADLNTSNYEMDFQKHSVVCFMPFHVSSLLMCFHSTVAEISLLNAVLKKMLEEKSGRKDLKNHNKRMVVDYNVKSSEIHKIPKCSQFLP